MTDEPKPASYRKLDIDNLEAISSMQEFRGFADREIQTLRKDVKEIQEFVSKMKGMGQLLLPLWIGAISIVVMVIRLIFFPA